MVIEQRVRWAAEKWPPRSPTPQVGKGGKFREEILRGHLHDYLIQQVRNRCNLGIKERRKIICSMQCHSEIYEGGEASQSGEITTLVR